MSKFLSLVAVLAVVAVVAVVLFGGASQVSATPTPTPTTDAGVIER